MEGIKKLHIMVGLPRSGKSTKATELGHPIVCPDAIRLALHGTLWRAETEPMVWAVAHAMVDSLFLAGHADVILDACNVSARRRQEWESTKWACIFHVIDTPKEVCIERARELEMAYLVEVIERMAAVWSVPNMGPDC